MLGFLAAFLAVAVNCFVMRRHFASLGQRRWSVYCVVTAIVTPVFVVLGSSITDLVGVIFAVGGAVAFGWVSAVAARLTTELSGSAA
jgi:purine-cytosine permease-like protein